MPIPQSATDAIKWFDRCNSSGRWGNAEQFASFVEDVIVDAHDATSPTEVKLLGTAIYIAAVEETLSWLRVPRHSRNSDQRSALERHCCRCNDVCSGCPCCMAPFATTPATVQCVSSAMTGMMLTLTSSHVSTNNLWLVSQTVVDAIVTMSQFACSSGAVEYLTTTFMEAMMIVLSQGNTIGAASIRSLHAMVASAKVCHAILSLSKFATTPGAVITVATTLNRVFTSFEKTSSFFANETVRDAFVAMAPHASSADATRALCGTTLAFIEKNRCGEVFAVKEVMLACAGLRRHTKDCSSSRQFVEGLLSRLTGCLSRSIMARSRNGEHLLEVQEATRMMTETVLAAADCAERDAVEARLNQMTHGATIGQEGFQQRRVLTETAFVRAAQRDQDSSYQALAAFAINVMFQVSSSSTRPVLLCASEAALASSGGCRQGDALGPVAVAMTTLSPLPTYQVCGQICSSNVALPVILQCFINDTILTASNSNQLCFVRAFLQKFSLTVPLLCGVRP
ncbi:Hypothetical protein, putative [Bodo saltans]|uniref:Uncharacterized protein n=1 Tax=Bodo saltans TaxID=75058 RepID=A0A0S4J8U3_BODSA|nr:Hypothetical protein, putative [Bodo saltans]|eukprot:CUG86614.1 Hypothetical protein, putative [Bodo saltans]